MLTRRICVIQMRGGGLSKYYFVWEGSKLDHVNSKTLDKPLKMFVSFWEKKINRPNKFTSFILTFPRLARIQCLLLFVPSHEGNDFNDKLIHILTTYYLLLTYYNFVNKTHPTNMATDVGIYTWYDHHVIDLPVSGRSSGIK